MNCHGMFVHHFNRLRECSNLSLHDMFGEVLSVGIGPTYQAYRRHGVCAVTGCYAIPYLLRLSGLLVAAGRMLPDAAVALLQSVQYANEEKEETDHADA